MEACIPVRSRSILKSVEEAPTMTALRRNARVVLSIGLLLLLPLSFAFLGQAAGVNSAEDVQASIRTFTKVFDVVEGNFADPIKPDKALYDGAIPGMLRTLDPH